MCAGRWSGLADPGQPLRRGEPESEPAGGKLQPLGCDPGHRRACPDADHGAGHARPVLRLERVRGASRRADGGDGAAAAGLHVAAADDDNGPGAGTGGPPPDADAAEPREPVRQPLRGRRRAPLRRRRRRHAAPRWPRQRLHGADLVPRPAVIESNFLVA